VTEKKTDWRKEKREKLLSRDRPFFRRVNIYDGDKYHRDIALLWVAYSKDPFYRFEEKLDQESFAREIERLNNSINLWIVEDRNKEFNGLGPVALVYAEHDSWILEPHVSFFPWATIRNKLRSTVAFFQWVRWQDIGVCLVKIIESSKPLFDRCQRYVPLFYVGKVVNGDPRGDMHIFSIKGQKNGRR
jgi:hypothetical protein